MSFRWLPGRSRSAPGMNGAKARPLSEKFPKITEIYRKSGLNLGSRPVVPDGFIDFGVLECSRWPCPRLISS